MDGQNYNDDLDDDFIAEEWQFVADNDAADADDDDSLVLKPGAGVNFFIDDDDEELDEDGSIWETDEDGEFIDIDDADEFDDGFIKDDDEEEDDEYTDD